MKVELRRRLHPDTSYHYELILIPTKTESRSIDGLLDEGGEPQIAEFPFPIYGQICTDDNFNTYIRIILVTDLLKIIDGAL